MVHIRTNPQALVDAGFRQIAESLPQLLWFTKPDGTVDFVNKRWEDYSGISRENLSPEVLLDAIHPDDRNHSFTKWDQAIKEGQPLESQYRLRDRNGNYRWFLTRTAPIRDGNGKLIRWL